MGRQAVILAGGFGTRLKSLCTNLPKAMVLINGVPFLDYIIKILKQQNFDNFVLLTGYKSEVIKSYYKNMGESIEFVTETKPLGTGGAVLNAYNYLKDEFFLINGDTLFDIDYSLLENFGRDKDFTIALRYSNDISRYGFIEINDNFKVKYLSEKTFFSENQIDGYINGGIYFVKKNFIAEFTEKYNSKFISLEKDIFPNIVKKGELYGLPLGGYFIDIGIPEDYYKAQKFIPCWCNKEIKPALFIDKDGTIIENTGYPSGEKVVFIQNTIDILKKYSKKNYHIVMITNQSGIAKNKFTIDEMYKSFESIRSFYKNLGVYFDDIEYCPYHKDGTIKEYSYDTLLRKPNPGMILKACEKLKIDLKNSIMIGDNIQIDKVKLPYLQCKIIGG